MAWLIKRTAPNEPIAFLGIEDRWVVQRKPRAVPELAHKYTDHSAAEQIAQWQRENSPYARGASIAVVSLESA